MLRGKGQPDRVIYDILATLNKEKERHGILGLYEGRLRSHVENFEGLKRKWQGFTGVPLPKKLRTSESIDDSSALQERADSNNEHSLTGEEGMVVVDEEVVVEVEVQKTKPRSMTKTEIKMEKDFQVSAPAPPTTATSHPDVGIDIDSMTVNDLRKELRKRQLGTAGRKAELLAKMRDHLAKEAKLCESKHTVAVKEATTSTHMNKLNITDNSGIGGVHRKVFNETDIAMEDAKVSTVNDLDLVVIEEQVATKMDTTSSKASDPPVESEVMMKEVAKPTNCYPSTELKKQAPKSALKPSKYHSSVSESNTQINDAKIASDRMISSVVKEDPSATILNKISDSSTSSIDNSTVVPGPSVNGAQLQLSVSKAKVSSTLAHKTPGGSAFKIATCGSAMLLEKKMAHSAASEARKARLAEMRQKLVQPTATSSNSTTELPSSQSKYIVSSTLKKMASSSTLGESKPNSILTKMREKAAAEKNENVTAAPSKPTVTVEHISSTTSSSTNTINRVPQMQTSSQPAMVQGSMALKSILDPANKPTVAELTKQPSPKKQEEKPLSPMQTYEMSDREEESDSESESDEDDNQRPKKVIPDWAQKTNLHRALERQFSDGPNRLDPDKIFGEVLTCNLEEVFDKKKSKYQRRTSSGNWTKDHVTLTEKLTYKRVMGYDQK